jgi:hypothetical protein
MKKTITTDKLQAGMAINTIDGKRDVTWDGSSPWKVSEARVGGEWHTVVPNEREARMREWAHGWLADQSMRR